MTDIIQIQQIQFPFDSFEYIPDNKGGVFIHDNNFKQMYHLELNNPNPKQIELPKQKLQIFVCSTKYEIWTTQNKQKVLNIRNKETNTTITKKFKENIIEIDFIDEENCFLLSMKQINLFNCSKATIIDTFEFSIPHKFFVYYDSFILLKDEEGIVKGEIYQAKQNKIEIFATFQIKNERIDGKLQIFFANVLTINKTPHLIIQMNGGIAYLINLTNTNENIMKFSSLEGNVAFFSIDDMLLISNREEIVIHSFISNSIKNFINQTHEDIEDVVILNLSTNELTLDFSVIKQPLLKIPMKIDFIDETSTINNLLLNESNGRCEMYSINFEAISKMIYVEETKDFDALTLEFACYYFHKQYNLCEKILIDFGNEKKPAHLLHTIFEIVLIGNKEEFSIEKTILSLKKEIDDSYYINTLFIELLTHVVKMKQTLSEPLQYEMIQHLITIDDQDTIHDFIQLKYVSDLPSIGMLLTLSKNQIIKKCGFDMLNRLNKHNDYIKLLLKNGETVNAIRYLHHNQNKANISNAPIYESLATENNKSITDQIKFFLVDGKISLPGKFDPLNP